MVAPNLCDQCKSHIPSTCSSPCVSSKSTSTPRSCTNESKANNKSIYVKAEPSNRTCIVVGKGGRKCGGNIFLRLPSPSSNLKLMCGGKQSSSSNCIQIMGNSVIKTHNGEFQIIPYKGKSSGTMQISMASRHPCLQFGGSARQCGSSGLSGSGAMIFTHKGGQFQLNLQKGKCSGPSITCGPNGSNVEITYGPGKRKLDMNHCKPTIAYMIHKRMVELETELRMAECSYSDLHPCNDC